MTNSARDVVHVVDQWVAERAEVDAGRGVGRWVAFTDLQNGVSPDALVVVGGDAVADERGRVCDAPEFADDGQAECISEEYADGQAVGLLTETAMESVRAQRWRRAGR